MKVFFIGLLLLTEICSNVQAKEFIQIEFEIIASKDTAFKNDVDINKTKGILSISEDFSYCKVKISNSVYNCSSHKLQFKLSGKLHSFNQVDMKPDQIKRIINEILPSSRSQNLDLQKPTISFSTNKRIMPVDTIEVLENKDIVGFGVFIKDYSSSEPLSFTTAFCNYEVRMQFHTSSPDESYHLEFLYEERPWFCK